MKIRVHTIGDYCIFLTLLTAAILLVKFLT